ncbi:MAG: amidohydrolase family protein [Candidatus Bathyarchaeia archaeon]
MIVDVHGHLPPSAYIKALSRRKKIPRIEMRDGGEVSILYGKGLQYSVDERMISLDKKLEAMNKSKVDLQILGIIMPGLDNLEKEDAHNLTREVNDEFAALQDKYRRNFLAVGTVPLQYPDIAIEELRRIKNELGMPGVEIFSNVAGRPLDSPEFLPFFAEAEKLRMPILLHPTLPLMAEFTSSYGLTGVVGYLFDTTLAILRIIFSGILEKHPKLKIILPHLGSTIPYLIGRIDHQFSINPDCRQKISKPPSEYFKLVYVDTAQSLNRPSLECAYRVIGPKRIMFGTDYPFADLSKSIKSIADLDIPEEEKHEIFEKNAVEMFGI